MPLFAKGHGLGPLVSPSIIWETIWWPQSSSRGLQTAKVGPSCCSRKRLSQSPQTWTDAAFWHQPPSLFGQNVSAWPARHASRLLSLELTVDTVSDTQKHPGSATVLLKHLCLPLVFRYKIHHIFTGCFGCYSSQFCDQIPNNNEPEEAVFSLAHGSKIQSIMGQADLSCYSHLDRAESRDTGP